MKCKPLIQRRPLDDVDRRIINQFQGGFPVDARPFAVAGAAVGLSETELLARVTDLKAQGYLSRFGPLYNAEALGGGVTLAAMQVPAERLDQIAALLDAMPEVAHNYLRSHQLNMWFVVLTQRADEVPHVLARIQNEAGLHVFAMPKEKEFFLELKFQV